MKPEVIEFYQSKHLPIEQLLSRGQQRNGLNKSSIYESLEQVYYEYQDSKIQKDILIAWRVWQVAKTVSGKRFDKLLKTKEQLNETILQLLQDNKTLKIRCILLTVGWVVTAGWVLFEVLK